MILVNGSNWQKIDKGQWLKVWSLNFLSVSFGESCSTVQLNLQRNLNHSFPSHPKKVASVKPSSDVSQECFSILTLSRRLSASRVQLLSELRQCLRRMNLRESGCLLSTCICCLWWYGDKYNVYIYCIFIYIWWYMPICLYCFTVFTQHTNHVSTKVYINQDGICCNRIPIAKETYTIARCRYISRFWIHVLPRRLCSSQGWVSISWFTSCDDVRQAQRLQVGFIDWHGCHMHSLKVKD